MARYKIDYDQNRHTTLIDYYRGKSNFPTIIILPILASKPGKALDAKIIGWVFRSLAWNVCIAYHPQELFKSSNSIEQFAEKIRLSRIGLFAVKDWVFAHAPDPQKVVLWGVSFGGILAVSMANLIPEFKAVVAVMAGGPIAQVVSHSKEGRVKQFWERVLQQYKGKVT